MCVVALECTIEVCVHASAHVSACVVVHGYTHTHMRSYYQHAYSACFSSINLSKPHCERIWGAPCCSAWTLFGSVCVRACVYMNRWTCSPFAPLLPKVKRLFTYLSAAATKLNTAALTHGVASAQQVQTHSTVSPWRDKSRAGGD